MIKDENFLKKLKYLSGESYRKIWESNDYTGYSPTHGKKIKNFWDTFEHFGFNKKLLKN